MHLVYRALEYRGDNTGHSSGIDYGHSACIILYTYIYISQKLVYAVL